MMTSIGFGCFSGAAGFVLVMLVIVSIQWKATGLSDIPWRVFAAYFCLSTAGGGLAGAVLSRFYTVRPRRYRQNDPASVPADGR